MAAAAVGLGACKSVPVLLFGVVESSLLPQRDSVGSGVLAAQLAGFREQGWWQTAWLDEVV